MIDIPLVSICCITYNHSNYIKDAIEGFLMQKTTFPVEIIIHDDASTDGTAEIIKEYAGKYPDKIFSIFQSENQYSKKRGRILLRFVYPHTRGKYIALCEGDDYWSDRYKLQKQVDFLEANPEFGLTFTKAKIFVQNEGKFKGCVGGSKEKFEDLLLGNTIATLTTCFRKDLLDQYLHKVNPATKEWKMGDYPMWLYFAHESKIKFDSNVTAVYRQLESSASNFTTLSKRIDFIVSTYDISIFYLRKYCHKNKILYDSVIEHYMWNLFTCWCRLNTPQLKNQIEHEIKLIQHNKSIEICLIQLTFKVPIFRYLFNYYYEIRNQTIL